MRPLFSKILRGCIVPSSRQFSKKAKRSPIPSLARSADVSKVLSDQHSSVIFKDVHCMTDFLSAVLGRPAAIEGSPIAPRTVHLRGVPGKAKQFSYGFSLVLNDPSPEATKRVTHIFRHVLLEGQNGFQDSVAARALIHLTVDRYETFANLVTEKGIAIAAAKKAAEAAQASGSTTGGIADTACSGGVTREHGASNAVQIASFVELPPAILVTVQDFVPVKLKSADVVSSALSRGVSMAAVNSWLSERVIGSDECFEHPATNLQLDDAGGLVVDLRMDLPPNTAVLPMAAVSGGATGAIQAFVLLTVPVAGCTEPVVSMKFAMEAPRPLANGAAVHAYEPSAMASLRNHDHYVFVFLPLLVCGAATLKGLWRHGGGGSDDDLDRLRKWALLFLHRPAKTDSTPPCVSNDPLLSRGVYQSMKREAQTDRIITLYLFVDAVGSWRW